MAFRSPFTIDIPQVDLLSYLFPTSTEPCDDPTWISASDPSISLSPRQLLQWVKQLGVGLKGLGLQTGDVVMMFSPNHIFVPVAYLGIVGYGAVFSGLNPASSLNGMEGLRMQV